LATPIAAGPCLDRGASGLDRAAASATRRFELFLHNRRALAHPGQMEMALGLPRHDEEVLGK
jgi:hypothetical protein